jgi:ubiquinone/menaquinone biosynthesis C-methylase UbiE
MAAPTPDSTERFTGRSDVYNQHRPRYPAALFQYLLDKGIAGKGSAVADVGAGTGIFSKGLLEIGAEVYAVEPNREMRERAERELSSNPFYHSVAGRAEATTLPSKSMDAITVAQALHWFDLVPTRAEFRRLMKPGAEACAVYNDRDVSDTFSQEYEELVSEYTNLDKTAREIERNPQALFEDGPCTLAVFPNLQELDREGLLGRVFSASYMPRKGQPRYEEVRRQVCDLFERNQVDGIVRIRYRTLAYHGPLE